MIFNQYPYLNLNDLNLDYIMKAIKEMRYEVTNFVSINAIKYADPIQWNITSQYEKNTIVIDPVTGTAYISVAPVPAGVALTRPEYWTVVFDLGSFVTRAAQNFTSRWESETTTTATFPTNAGEWLVWGDVLYKALVNIAAGDTYVVNSNIEHFTIEDLYNAYLNTIASILIKIGDLDALMTSDKSNVVNAINEVIGDINNVITDYENADNDILSAMQDEMRIRPHELIGNLLIDHVITADSTPQGSCYVGNDVVVMYRFISGANGYLTAYDIVNQTFLWSYPISAYHGNSVVYRPIDNLLYICTMNNDMILTVDLDNPSTINSVINAPVNNLYSIGYDRLNDVFYATSSDNQNVLYKFNGIFDSVASTVILENYPSVKYNANSQGIGTIENGLVYYFSYDPDCPDLIGAELETGKIAYIGHRPRIINGYKTCGECQSMIYDYDHDRYMLSGCNFFPGLRDDNYEYHNAIIYEIDLYKSISVIKPYIHAITGTLDFSTSISCDESLISSVVPYNHKTVTAFRCPQDAINLAVNSGNYLKIVMNYPNYYIYALNLSSFKGLITSYGDNIDNARFRYVPPAANCDMQFTYCKFVHFYTEQMRNIQLCADYNSRISVVLSTFDDYVGNLSPSLQFHMLAIRNGSITYRLCTFNGTKKITERVNFASVTVPESYHWTTVSGSYTCDVGNYALSDIAITIPDDEVWLVDVFTKYDNVEPIGIAISSSNSFLSRTTLTEGPSNTNRLPLTRLESGTWYVWVKGKNNNGMSNSVELHYKKDVVSHEA